MEPSTIKPLSRAASSEQREELLMKILAASKREKTDTIDDNGRIHPGEPYVLNEPLTKTMASMLSACIDDIVNEPDIAPREAIAIELARLSLHFMHRDKGWSPEQWDLLLEDYLDDLSIYPLTVIQRSCRRWRKNEKWWPRVAELLPILDDQLSYREARLSLFKKLDRANKAAIIEASQRLAAE